MNQSERIATYTDYRRAARAAEHLADEGFDLEQIRIVARDLGARPVRSGTRFTREAGHAVFSAAISATGSLLLLVAVGGVAMTGRYLAFVLVGAGAVVAGVLSAAFLYVAGGGGVSRRRIVPGGYDIQCTDRPGDAEQSLARWWSTEINGPARTPRGYVVRPGEAGRSAAA